MAERGQPADDGKPGLTFAQLAKSTLAAFIGVQSNANRERDFTQGKFSTFIIGGILFALLFIVVVYAIVQLVLKLAGF